MFYFPIPEGQWSVEISTEGYQATSSTTDPNKGRVDGLIAYDDSSEGWNIGIGNNVEITNNKADNTWKYGHPNLEINSCHFKQQQCLERDGVISCHVKTIGPSATIFVVAPPVQKLSKYNYAVSYGAWTERDMEIGLITVTLDEKRDSGSARRKILRSGLPEATNFTLVEHPEKENFGIQTSETPLAPVISPKAQLPTLSDSDSEDDPLSAAPDVGFGGTRLLVDTDIKTIPDPSVAEAFVNSAHVGEDPWAEVRAFKSAQRPPRGPSSVASGSISGGSLRGTLRPASEPARETPYERDENKTTRRQKSRFSFGGGRS
nr:P5 [Barley yellow dwarf virus]